MPRIWERVFLERRTSAISGRFRGVVHRVPPALSRRIVSRLPRRVSVLETYSHLHVLRVPISKAGRDRLARAPTQFSQLFDRNRHRTRNMHANICGMRFDSARDCNNISKLIWHSHIFFYFWHTCTRKICVIWNFQKMNICHFSLIINHYHYQSPLICIITSRFFMLVVIFSTYSYTFHLIVHYIQSFIIFIYFYRHFIMNG